MTIRQHIILTGLLPILLVGGLMMAGVKVPVPEWGRDYVLQLLMPDAAAELELPNIYGPSDPAAPLVVIDAGHGGRDLGAVGAGVREKDVTLALAIALRDAIVEQGGIRVALTREDDRLITLTERPDIARPMEPDLFLSIHADFAAVNESVSGASFYTTSSRASSLPPSRVPRTA